MSDRPPGPGAPWSQALRDLLSPVPVPVHMLQGGHPAGDAAFRGLLGLGYLLKLLALPAVAVLCADRLAVVLPALALLFVGVWGLGTRWPRSCAAPMRDEALLLLGAALVLALGRAGDGGAAVLAVAGGIGAAVAIGALLAMFGSLLLTWGGGGVFVEMRRRTFRILGDNPDAIAMVCRLRIRPGDRGLLLTIPKTADGPTNLAVNLPSMKVAAKVSWRELQPVLAERGVAHVFLGEQPPDDLAPDFHLKLAPGRYMASVRNYLPWHRDEPPTLRRL